MHDKEEIKMGALQRLPLSKNPIFNHGSSSDLDTPKITIFTAPTPFTGSSGTRRSLAIRSWLALSPQITVILFSQHPSAASFANSFGYRVLVEPDIDFTFLGVPFFHSMVARSRAFTSDIYVFMDTVSILPPDFVLALNCAHELDNDWFLFASPRNVSNFPFYLDEDEKYWLKEDGKRNRTQEDTPGSSWQWNCCEGRMMIAWNNGELPFYIMECFLLSSLYGSSSLHEINYSGVVKLLKCDGHYLLINTTEDILHPYAYKRMSLWKGSIAKCWRSKKTLACVSGTESHRTEYKNRTVVLTVAGYSYKDMLMSWVCRLRRLRITNFLVCALDYETYQFSIMQGLPVFNDPSAPSNISSNDCHFGTKCFQRVTNVKSRMVLKILKLGYNVLLSDVDVTGLEIHCHCYSLLILPFWQLSLMNTTKQRVTIHFLDRNLFPNGAYLGLWERKNVKSACKKLGCLVLHNNWISGRMKKLERQRAKDNAIVACTMPRFHKFLTMLKECAAFLAFDRHANRDSGCKKNLGGAPMSVDLSLQSRDISVRIVHAGGQEELYQNSVPVSHLMEKYPGMCIARPEVFKNPHGSLLWPEDRLLPGQKYYIIPSTTAQKLKRRHHEKVKVEGAAEGREGMSDARITWDVSGENLEESANSAKEFYLTKPSKVSKVPKERQSKYSLREGGRVKKPFVPPLPRTRLLRESGWEPSLTSVQELSP
ncbi:hypothetical protein CRYUN_Cryun21dG0062400 [Craigia yunnanensis]